jgi:ribonuclease D
MSASDTSLLSLADDARAAGRIALDTEFMGEGRYRTLLCLVQVAVPDGTGGERTEVLDPLQEDGRVDFAPLAEVLADPAVEVVVHAGRQDVALMRRHLDTEVRNVFDTQVAAGFVGMPAQSSYEALLAEMLGVRLKKSASFTRWNARPLSPEQHAYAREDVLHLLELASELERCLDVLGRLQWAREECEPLQQASDERDPDAILVRLPRIRNLSGPSRAVARELVVWRERSAATHDRPVQSVLSDATLVEIAKRKPASPRELEQIRGAGAARSKAREVIDAIRRGRERQADPLPDDRRRPPPDPDDAPLVSLAEALIRARAREAGLAYELLATRADLQSIVAARRLGGEEADARTLRGWRRELVGNELLELLDGRVSLAVRNRRLEILPQ